MTAVRAATVQAPRAIDAELASELEKQAAWISPRVRDVRVDGDGRTVRFAVEGEGDAESERQKVARFVADMTERHRPTPRKVVARRVRAGRAVVTDAFGELEKRGWVVPIAPGRVSLRGPALAVVRALDEDCARVARDSFGATEEAHPALAPTALLARCGWFASFPHAASFVAHLAEDYDAIERFRAANAGRVELAEPGRDALAPMDACLLPALCYAVYAARERTALGPDGAVVTCAGRCFRYESRNLAGLERLWEFGMREIVFMGDDERVAAGRRAALQAALDQLDRWDLEGTVETANDPFFPAARAGRAFWQRSAERKFELRLTIGRDDAGAARSVACASFNVHDRFFGTAFSIAAEGGAAASSGCVGWGLERWMLACFAQHGFDPEAWPSWLRDRVFR